MSKIDQFKEFVRQKPQLISYVKKGDTTWQKLYEVWDLYGENNTVWDQYNSSRSADIGQEQGLKDIVDRLKNVNVDTVVRGLNGLQKAIALAQDFFTDDNTATNDTYTPRPINRRFED